MPQPVETVPVEEAPEAVAELPDLPVAAVEASPVEEPAAAEIEIIEGEPVAAAQEEEVDLSSEWASLLEETKQPAPHAEAKPVEAAPVVPPAAAKSAPPPPPPVEEFDLPEFTIEEPAPAASEPAHAAAHTEQPPAQELEVPAAAAPVEDEGFNPFAEISAEIPSIEAHTAEDEIASHAEEQLLPDEELTALPVPPHAEVAAEGAEPALEVPQAAIPETPAPEPEFEVEQDFELVLEPEPVVPLHEMMASPPPPIPAAKDEPEKVKAPANGHTFSSDQFLSDLAAEIDHLGMGELTPPPDRAPEHLADEQAVANKAKEAAGEPGPLREVFEEFRAELGEMGAEDEDLETHYNLGVAFREMGLLEEAIGEFQKVAKASDRGKAFRYAMQCSTLLGLAFMEKGQPSIAAIWYERALLTPGIDSESKLALRYDLGVAQESAGEMDAALKSFSQVYAVNIDYRDVAERIASLQKPAR
jgi:tetratricopeptide (TPR) repeat protein